MNFIMDKCVPPKTYILRPNYFALIFTVLEEIRQNYA